MCGGLNGSNGNKANISPARAGTGLSLAIKIKLILNIKFQRSQALISVRDRSLEHIIVQNNCLFSIFS